MVVGTSTATCLLSATALNAALTATSIMASKVFRPVIRAGVAAAVAIADGTTLRDVDIRKVQDTWLDDSSRALDLGMHRAGHGNRIF